VLDVDLTDYVLTVEGEKGRRPQSYCDYYIWCASCTVVFVLYCVSECMWGCFGNMCTCVYCVLYCLYCVFVLFRLSIFIPICFVCTSVRTTATE